MVHKHKPYKCSICGAKVPNLPMTVLKHQMSHVRRRSFARAQPQRSEPSARTMAGRSDVMPIDHDQAQMWQLSSDRRSVRMELPGLKIEGIPEPLRVKIHFDAVTTDQIIERLLVLPAQTLPAPPKPSKRH